MRGLILFVTLLLAAPGLAWQPATAGKDKGKAKQKQKSFEPVVVTDFREVVGRYDGGDPETWVDVAIGPDGGVQLTLQASGHSVTIQDLVLEGAFLRGVRVDAEGVSHSFEAAFGDRVLNGERRFGLVVEGEHRIDDSVVLSRLFYRHLGVVGR